MASRPIVPQQQRGGVVVGEGKPKTGAVYRRNRRALGDIGNVVTASAREVEGKQQPQISRPVTRSLCAQLRAKEQAPAAEENSKKPVAVVIDNTIVVNGAVKNGGLATKEVAQKKATVNENPEKVSEVCPETKRENPASQRKGKSSKKKVQTLTSVLTARSKVACGVTDKPKDPIADIDAADADDQLAVVEYVEDIYKFYKLAENETLVHGYMDLQPDINERMRAILADWLIEVHNKFELMPETLYLTLNIVDRFLSIKIVPRKELQLLGISAMLIACKYEEIWAPEVNDFVCISDRNYTREQILVMEKAILGKLEWSLSVPTPYVFLVRFIKAANSDTEMENMVFFLAELGVMQYATIMYSPSMVAASAVYAAQCTLKKSPSWSKTLNIHTGFSEPQLMNCAKLLVNFHYLAANSKLKVVYRKYSSPQRSAVALHLPASKLLASHE